jgi:hypothetical protein
MLIVVAINAKYQKHFIKEMKESFEVIKHDKPLGEKILEKMLK